MCHLDVAFTQAWPTSTPQAAEALAATSESHRVEPLLAYDLNGVLIEPHYYMKRLDGTTVILRFELTHHLIHRQGKALVDTFSARIVQIRVIFPLPGAAPVTPQKKRVLNGVRKFEWENRSYIQVDNRSLIYCV